MNLEEPRPIFSPDPVAAATPHLEPAGPPLAPVGDNAPPVSERADQDMPTLPFGDAPPGGSHWEQDRRVAALWSADQDRNAWVGIAGVGWRRLDGRCDSALVALTMLAAHAREQGARVSYREQDGVIQELYVW
ncbi:MAG: hypothetical protein MUC77_10825 [Chromatiaceae bacterium]|jgi:hypothetical protein|nr:hypothetical protein [Chromatiaceae bacterium]